MALHVLGHVEADHRGRARAGAAAELRVRERLGELGLANPGRPREHQRRDGARAVAKARRAARDRARCRLNGRVLPEHAARERGGEARDGRALVRGERLRRDARPRGDDGRDVGDGHDGDDRGRLAGRAREPRLELELARAQERRLLEEALARGEALGLEHLLELRVRGAGRGVAARPAERGAPRGVRLDARARAGLVDQVNRLVGEEAVGDVACGEGHGRRERAVGVDAAVVPLVPLGEPLQHGQRLRLGRLGDGDGLEAPLERRVFLKVLGKLVARRRGDALELAARKRGLEQVGDVEAACPERGEGKSRGGEKE